MQYILVFFILLRQIFLSDSCSSRSRPPFENCQNLTLKPTEYTLENNVLVTKYNVTFVNFWPQNDSVNVCYPFSAKFITCYAQQYTRSLQSNEYERLNDTAVLRDLVHKINYPPGCYQFRPGDHIRVCVPLHNRPPSEALVLADNYFSIGGSILSAISMFVSFLIYVTLRNPVTDLNPTLNHMASLFIVYVFIAAQYLTSKADNDFVCYLIAFGKQFGLIAAMCWMNVVAFELWWRFRPNKLLQLSSRNNERNWWSTTRQYGYGWGIPLIILVTTTFSEIYKTPIYPNLLDSCWISGITAQIALYYGPTSLCLSINIVLFILTMISLCRVRQYIAFSQGKHQNQILSMSAKLLVIMGIPWIFDVIIWVSNTRPKYWIFSEIVMAFQGVVLAFVYLSRQHIRDALKKKLSVLVADKCYFFTAKRMATSWDKGNIPLNARNSTTPNSVSVI